MLSPTFSECDSIITILKVALVQRKQQINQLQVQKTCTTEGGETSDQQSSSSSRTKDRAARELSHRGSAADQTSEPLISVPNSTPWADPAGDAVCSTLANVALDDLKRVATVGQGTFGSVRLVTHEDPNSGSVLVLGLKQLAKAFLVSQGLHKQVREERDAMIAVWGHPNICRLYESRNDRDCLYLLLEFVPGGELLSVLVPVKNRTNSNRSRNHKTYFHLKHPRMKNICSTNQSNSFMLQMIFG